MEWKSVCICGNNLNLGQENIVGKIYPYDTVAAIEYCANHQVTDEQAAAYLRILRG